MRALSFERSIFSRFSLNGIALVGLVTLGLLLAHRRAVATDVPATPALRTVTIIGTSDLHGRLASLPLFGGYLDILRAGEAPVVLVDAGDMYQGTLESAGDEGASVIAAYAQLCYNAIAIGNHDFDFGPVGVASTPQSPNDQPRGALQARAAQAEKHFPFLAANLLEKGKPLSWRNVKPSTWVKTTNGLQVGIIGATTIDTPHTTIAANFSGLSVSPLLAAVSEQAIALRKQGAHIVVLTVHAGGRCEKFHDTKDLSSCDPQSEIFALAQALPVDLVDVIIAGHVHAGLAHEVNGVAISEAFAQGQAFGRVDVSYDLAAKRVTHKRIHAPERMKVGDNYEGKSVALNAAVERVVQPAIAAAQAKRDQRLGAQLDATLKRSYQAESALGNWLTSTLLLLEPKAQVALTNGGGLRADLPAGELTYGALYDAFPFDNRLARISLSGAALKKMLRANLLAKHGVLSIAGTTVNAQCRDGELDVRLQWPSGKWVSDDESIVVVTNDFLASGGDNFGEHAAYETGAIIREALVTYLARKPSRIETARWFDPTRPRLSLPSPRPVHCVPERPELHTKEIPAK